MKYSRPPGVTVREIDLTPRVPNMTIGINTMTGMIHQFMGDLPQGYIIPNGRGMLRSSYPELAEILDDLYGGDRLTFNLPDFRGYFDMTIGTERFNPEPIRIDYDIDYFENKGELFKL